MFTRDQALACVWGRSCPRCSKKKTAWPSTSTTSVSACGVRGLFRPHGALQPELRLLFICRELAHGDHMDPAQFEMESLEILQDFFESTLPAGASWWARCAEPLLARRDAVYQGIGESPNVPPGSG